MTIFESPMSLGDKIASLLCDCMKTSAVEEVRGQSKTDRKRRLLRAPALPPAPPPAASARGLQERPGHQTLARQPPRLQLCC